MNCVMFNSIFAKLYLNTTLFCDNHVEEFSFTAGSQLIFAICIIKLGYNKFAAFYMLSAGGKLFKCVLQKMVTEHNLKIKISQLKLKPKITFSLLEHCSAGKYNENQNCNFELA